MLYNTAKSNGVTVEIIADSVCRRGYRLTTFRATYPRIALPHLLTHRMLSRNSQSSRAVPFKSMAKFATNAVPLKWGKNERGMQARHLLSGPDITRAKEIWESGRRLAIKTANKLNELGVHKEVTNRPMEPYLNVTTIISGTDFGNFFGLRVHPDAQEEIKTLATLMRDLRDCSVPVFTLPGEWHLPFITIGRKDNVQSYRIDGEYVSLETAITTSISACAQVSFRQLDTSAAKALKVYKRLTESTPIHASPLEHVATPFSIEEHDTRDAAFILLENTLSDVYPPAIATRLASSVYYCGNFKGWTQYRKTFDKEVST